MKQKSFFTYKLKFKFSYLIDLFVDYYLGKKSRLYFDNKLVCFSHDKISTSINLNGIYEKRDLDILFSFFKKYGINTENSIALDIGANIGNHSIYFKNHFKKVLSYEPLMTTFEVLKINTRRFENIEIYNFGISNQNGEFSMKVDPANIGGSKVDSSASCEDLKFEFFTLDYLKLNQEIGMIKIDVEGHEYEVLKGAEKTIKKHMPIVLFELNKNDFSNGRPKAYDLLKEFGYLDFYVIERNIRFNTGVRLFDNLASFLISTSVNVALMNEMKLADYPFIIAMPKKYDLNFNS
jgi:FkbM family methyltransferase